MGRVRVYNPTNTCVLVDSQVRHIGSREWQEVEDDARVRQLIEREKLVLGSPVESPSGSDTAGDEAPVRDKQRTPEDTGVKLDKGKQKGRHSSQSASAHQGKAN